MIFHPPGKHERPVIGLTSGSNFDNVPFTMTDTDVFLLQILEALESGLVRESSEQAQSALAQYTKVVSEAIGENVGNLSEEQIVLYNHDPSYPYWFAAYHHTHDEITYEYYFVRPKDDWYQTYLTVQAQFADLSEEDRNARIHHFVENSPQSF